MKMHIRDIKTDQNLLILRPVNAVFVSRYRQAYRAGANMPPITVDQNGVVISGNHRIQALIEEFGPDYEIEVIVKTFGTERERIEYFTVENSTHGNALDGISKKRIALALIKEGATQEDVARLFSVSVSKVVSWGENCVMVEFGKKTVLSPMKIGPEIGEGKTVSGKEYAKHISDDRGISPVSLIGQILRWIRNGWIKNNDKNRAVITELSRELEKWLVKA